MRQATATLLTVLLVSWRVLIASPAAGEEIRSADDRTLVLVRLQGDGPAVVRTLVVTDRLDQLRAEGRVSMPVFEKARGLGDLGACFIVDSDIADELTSEVTCGGGTGIDTSFDPIGRIEKELEPKIDPDAGDDLAKDEAPSREEEVSEDFSSRGSAKPAMDFGIGIKSDEEGKLQVWASALGEGGTLDDVDLGGGDDSGPTDEELRKMEEMRAEDDEGADAAVEAWVQRDWTFDPGPQEEKKDTSVIAEAVGAALDWLEEMADGADSSEGDDSTSDDPAGGEEGTDADEAGGEPTEDSSTTLPDPDGVTAVPAECEDELAERFDPGAIDPIDPHPDDAGDGGAYAACFGDATVVQNLATCAADLVALRHPDQGSLCAGGEVVTSVPMLTRNDLVIDDLSPFDAAVAVALATEFSARLAVQRAAAARTVR